MEEIYDRAGLAAFLKVEVKTINYLVDIRQLPYFKVSRNIRFRRSDIEAWTKSKIVWPDNISTE